MPVKSQFPDCVFSQEPLGKVYLQQFRKHKDKIAIVDEDDESNYYTYSELEEKIIKLTSYLYKSGIRKNDFITLCTSNLIEIPIIMFAAISCGATFSPINPSYTEEEISKLLQIAQPKVIFTTMEFLNKVKVATKRISSLQKIFIIDSPDKTESLQGLIDQGDTKDFPNNLSIHPKTDTCLVPFSSGTTGTSKGVMLTHENLNVLHTLVRQTWSLTSRNTTLLNLPNFHIFGVGLYLSYLFIGSKLISSKRFTSIEKMLSTVEKHKITDLNTVPPLLILMLNTPDLEKYDLSNLRRIVCGAAPLPQVVAEQISKRIGVVVQQGWGLTEMAPATVSVSTSSVVSVGVVTPNTQLKVVDTETSKELGPNQKGEIYAKGPQLMKGYYRRPDATKSCIDDEGWFHTGDIGYYDEDENFYIVDRLKELIKYKGFQIAPAELEEILLEHPDVSDVAVIGVPDLDAGELPKAFIVKRNSSLKEADIHEFLKGRVSRYKYLKGGITFCPSIPKSPSGKILRRYLRDNLKPKM